MLLSFIVSCAIEFTQSVIGRTADIADVILNTVGGVLGYLVYKLQNRIKLRLPKFMKSQIFLDVLSLFIILVIIYLAFKFNFWRIIW